MSMRSILMQNRHSKGSSKEAKGPDDDMEEKRTNSSSRGSTDYTTLRGHKKMSLSHGKRKREKQQPNDMDSGMKRVKKDRHSNFLNHEKQTEAQARGGRVKKKDMKRSSRREERKKIWKKQKKTNK